MKTTIYFFEDEINQFLKTENELKKFKKIFTNVPEVKELLKNRNLESETIDEYFPFGHMKTILNNKKSMKKLDEYRKIFQDIKYNEIKLFDSFEPRILNEIVFLTKLEEVIENNDESCFIFKGFSILYFSIIEIIKGKKDDVEILIKKIKKDKTEVFSEIEINEKKILKNRNLSHNFKNRAILKIKSKIKSKPNTTVLQEINQKMIKNKIQNKNSLFFFSPATDYVVSSIFPVIEEFENNKTECGIVVFDLETRKILHENKIKFLDLTEELQIMKNNLKDDLEVTNILKKIKELSKNNSVKELCIKDKFNPILNLISLIVSIIKITEIILKQNNPKSVVVCFDGNMYGNSVVTVSKKMEIQTFSIWPFLIPNDPIRATFKADKICVYGLHGKEVLKTLGYDEKNIILTGNPSYDYIKKIDVEYEQKQIEKIKIGQRKVIVLGFGRWNPNDDVWIPKFINFCSKHNFFVIIKVKPIYKVMLQDHHEFMVKSISEQCKKSDFYITIDDEPKTLIVNSDLVITGRSNFGVEALLHGVPVVSVNFTHNDEDKPNEIFHLDFMSNIKKYEDLEKTVLDVLNQKIDKERVRKENQKIIDKYNIFNDGHASKRLFELISGKKYGK